MTQESEKRPMMTREEAEAFKTRWREVNELTDEELRRLTGLFRTARALGWEERLREGEDEVRDRWRSLKVILRRDFEKICANRRHR